MAGLRILRSQSTEAAEAFRHQGDRGRDTGVPWGAGTGTGGAGAPQLPRRLGLLDRDDRVGRRQGATDPSAALPTADGGGTWQPVSGRSDL